MAVENTEDLKSIFTPGTELTDELLREAALTLPEDLAITFAAAGGITHFQGGLEAAISIDCRFTFTRASRTGSCQGYLNSQLAKQPIANGDFCFAL